MAATTPQQLAFERELSQHPQLVERILRELPPVQIEPERVIKCSPENIERATCRAVARCREWGEHWLIEVVE